MKKKITLLSVILLSSFLLLSWCKKKEAIIITESWDLVTINYDSYLLDWELIDANKTETITLWQQNSFPIFDTELLGLKVWDEKSFITNEPNEWYWIYHNNLKVQNISSSVINTIWNEPRIWEQINLWSLKWIITDITPATTTIDFNNRETRENVEFDVTILSIEKNVNEWY